jgi:hypothetical protein
MLYTDFCTEFNRSVDRGDVNSAHRALMQELGRILVRDKQDFVDLLNESGYEAELIDSDIDLVDTFVDNVDRSPSLMLGASMLTAAHNRKMGFDGDDGYLDDELVKSGYNVMINYYSEPKSNAVGAIVAGSLGAVAAGTNLARTQAEKKRERESMGRNIYEQKEASKQQIVSGILDAKKQQQDQLRASQQEDAKNKRLIYIIGGSILAIAVVGIAIYSIKKR